MRNRKAIDRPTNQTNKQATAIRRLVCVCASSFLDDFPTPVGTLTDEKRITTLPLHRRLQQRDGGFFFFCFQSTDERMNERTVNELFTSVHVRRPVRSSVRLSKSIIDCDPLAVHLRGGPPFLDLFFFFDDEGKRKTCTRRSSPIACCVWRESFFSSLFVFHSSFFFSFVRSFFFLLSLKNDAYSEMPSSR